MNEHHQSRNKEKISYDLHFSGSLARREVEHYFLQAKNVAGQLFLDL